ncbi:MAG: DUF2723 domain-containing protein [Bacteroidaceae bacterium]|nr:DUF2723 domain-containing protein [Bacteroidaceae bacterium]
MKQFKLINNVVGWIVFAIAAYTYCATVEPSASFWDCPEFIATADKLDVGHPPGAPFFMLTGNFFAHFASDQTQVALMVNIMSALLSALCILFLFWSVTHLARKLLCKDGETISLQKTAVIMAAGVCGALAYTWSDTFWFSAVEGEVYAYSSMFTALVFWLILKWEEHADEPGSDRWLVLIFYLTGLSIGVHLLNLLCLPAITLVYYYKKHPEAGLKQSIIALLVSFVLVAAVLYGVVPGIVKVGGWFELFCVNTLGLGFNSGMIIYVLVLIAVVLTAIWSTTRKDRALINALFTASVGLLGIPFIGTGTLSVLLGIVILIGLFFLLQYKHKGEYFLRKRVLNTSLLCMLMLMIGYSTYAVIIIRSTANTPMDQNSPEDIFTLGQYLSREQYGDTPLLYGPGYGVRPIDINKKTRVQRHEKQDPNEPDRYDLVEVNDDYVYPDNGKMLFPRMYSSNHAAAYESWNGGVDKDAYGRPSQADNLHFFLSYQINYMYWRYFMWNFAGRQNDIQGGGEAENGNWITGIPFIDNMLYGDQDLLPSQLKENKGHNVFYCLPLILGLLGLFWQVFRDRRSVQQFWVVFFLFFMTGLAIVLYLNQTPGQPRERDYAYAGSFYAFAIWIGLGIAAIYEYLEKLLKGKSAIATALVSVIAVLVPLQMVSQTWDDHDRSRRFACRDFGANYLKTLPDDGAPIIYTNGDNDTFPLWYGQEVEGIATHARVCNLSYLQTDWYTDQMVRPAYDSPGLPIDWKKYEYVDNMGHDFFRINPDAKYLLDEERKNNPSVNPYELRYIIDNYVRKGQPIPTDSVIVSVNKENVRKSGMFLPYGPDSIPDYITISWEGRGALSKSEMMVYEILARNDWKRPIYMSVTLGEDNYAGLKEYFMLEGLAFRVTPFRTGGGEVDLDKMYDNMMNRFKYGNVKDPKVYLDETNMRMCRTHRHMFNILIRSLLGHGDKKRALKALQKSEEELPYTTIPLSATDLELADLWERAGNNKKAEEIYLAIFEYCNSMLQWASTLSDRRFSLSLRDCIQYYQVCLQIARSLEDMQSAKYNEIEVRMEQLNNTRAGSVALQTLIERSRMMEMQSNSDEESYGMGGYGGSSLGGFGL